MPLPPGDDEHLFSHAESAQARRQFVIAVRNLAVSRATTLAVGCERFRLRHGHWPDTLAELPADLVLGDTTDPYTGRPLVIKRLADGLAVYSVGPDGADDGGVFGPAPADPPRQDVGVRLWDAAVRGRP